MGLQFICEVKIMPKNALMLGLAVFTFVGSCSIAQAADGGEYVYVESNTSAPNSNSIYAFRRGSGGSLTPLPGSPFLTGGAGVQYNGSNLGPFDSDSEVIVNPDQTLLFAVNAGSDTVAVFSIKEDGTLVTVPGSPFPSGGNDPVSLALDGNVLIVANQSGDFARPSTILPNYTTLRVGSNGTLIPFGTTTNDTSRALQNTVSVAAGTAPSQAFFPAGTNLLFGADFLGGLLQHFRIEGDGELHPLSPIALPASEFDATTPRFPLGLWSNPKAPILYVGYVTANKMGVYGYNEQGGLKFLRTVPNAGQGICWIRSNQSGTRLYTTDTTTNQVSVYDSTDAEYPIEIQTLTLSGVGNAFQLSLSNNGKSLYVLSQRAATSIPEGQGNVLHSLSIKDDGTLQEIGSGIVFNLPSGTRPQGVAVVDQY
jgi:DNA-binding beta-propeller fold protein YncE